jgi:concentrative nucleoside transporter, CNT family
MILKLASVLGMFAMIAMAWGISLNRKKFPWRTVISGVTLQFVFAWLILMTRPGRAVFGATQTAVQNLLDCAKKGGAMVFGPLSNKELLETHWGPANGVILAITVTVTIILVAALSSLLYHYGILQRVVRAMAWVMQRVMRTSGSESLAAAANVFMGQTEAPLVIRPYLPRMTQSEIMALMVGGMATIAGGVLAAYVDFGVSAGHLLTASVMSAPASLMIAKIILPETAVSETAAGASAAVPRETINGLDALCLGASDGLKLSLNVMAMLIAFVAVVALTNYLLALPQQAFGVAEPLTLQTVFGWLNAPFAWLIGIAPQDCMRVGAILGERIVLNEFVGYVSLSQQKALMTERSFALATYALCGFANFSSIAIQIGGIGALVPSRRNDLARLGLRAMVGGLLACYLTATVVGIFLK